MSIKHRGALFPARANPILVVQVCSVNPFNVSLILLRSGKGEGLLEQKLVGGAGARRTIIHPLLVWTNRPLLDPTANRRVITLRDWGCSRVIALHLTRCWGRIILLLANAKKALDRYRDRMREVNLQRDQFAPKLTGPSVPPRDQQWRRGAYAPCFYMEGHQS